MKKKVFSRIAAIILSAAICAGTAPICSIGALEKDADILNAEAIVSMEGIAISNENICTNNYKNEKYNNPISSEFFCADPTAVEYEGRLYLFGTNDHEQFEVKGADVDNTYEQIHSFVVLSTDDMVNWIYHGEINVDEVAPWITNSWAPSIVSRVEDDGLTHFYLYFSNNGLGVGVITATNPLGPWSDPLGKPLVSTSTPGLSDCPNPFDPGAVIDENGVGWLSFGAGKASNGTDYMPGSVRIVQLGDDMISFASGFAQIPAPYSFEASELNYINGTYIYTYNTDWSDHSTQWDYDCAVPSQCSMVYMTTKTPLDSSSWEMRGECFVNPGTAGFDYSNNHTHMHKFKGKYYMFYHTLILKSGMGISGSYRSLCVDEIEVDEQSVTIEKTAGTKIGADSIICITPFETNLASQLNNTADISFDTADMSAPVVVSDAEGSWISVRDAQFTASQTTEEEDEEVILEATDIEKITYDITVKSIDQSTTLTMNPFTKDGVNHAGSVAVDGAGSYTIECEISGTNQMMNMGYFSVSNDAQITFMLDTMTINDKYVFDMSVELTNTREWADGLKNIWNGFSDGDKVYSSDFAEFVYSADNDAIEFVAGKITDGSDNSSAPLVDADLTFLAKVRGTGRIEVRLDSPTGHLLSFANFDSPDDFAVIYNNEVAPIGGTHDLYFVFSDADIEFESWAFAKSSEDTPIGDIDSNRVVNNEDALLLKRHIHGKNALADIDNADLNADGSVNVADLVAMKRNIIG